MSAEPMNTRCIAADPLCCQWASQGWCPRCEAAAVAPPSAPPEPRCVECGQTDTALVEGEDGQLRCLRNESRRVTQMSPDEVRALLAPPETTAPPAPLPCPNCGRPFAAHHPHVVNFGNDTDYLCTDRHGTVWPLDIPVSPVASSATPTPEPTMPGVELCECGEKRCYHFGRGEFCTNEGFEAQSGPTFRGTGKYAPPAPLSALASSQQEIERLRAALESIQASGFAWAGEEGDAYGFDARSTQRIEALATIAVEALHPKSEADEMDCRSIPR